MEPLKMIAEWRKGCSNGTKEHPEECHECTLELINCLESTLKREKRVKELFPYKVGDRIRIVKKAYLWDSGLGGNYPWDTVKVGDIIKIISIDSEDTITCFNGVKENGVYGFLYCDDIKDCYELVDEKFFYIGGFWGEKDKKQDRINLPKITYTWPRLRLEDVLKMNQFYNNPIKGETKMKYEKVRDFTAEDLYLRYFDDNYIEYFIKEFGFTKIVPVDEKSISVMEKINGCIPFLLEEGFIKEVKKVFYKKGDLFKGKTGILYALVMVDTYKKCCIIDFQSANRLVDPVEVRDPWKITQEEFDKMRGYFILEKVENGLWDR